MITLPLLVATCQYSGGSWSCHQNHYCSHQQHYQEISYSFFSRPPKGFKKIFGKIKRSNSGGHLAAAPPSPAVAEKSPVSSSASPSKRSGTPEPFRRGGLRATAGGRLGWSNASTPNAAPKPEVVQRPFREWTTATIGRWMESLGLGMYVRWVRPFPEFTGDVS